MKARYTVAELLYSAGARCACGAGLAYPLDHNDARELSAWVCSRVLLGEVEIAGASSAPSGFFAPVERPDVAGVVHQGFPFASYEIKSEGQPSARGATTRPAGTHIESEPHCRCRACGHEFVAARRRNDNGRDNEGLDCPKCGATYLSANSSLSMQIEARFRSVVVADDAPASDDGAPSGCDAHIEPGDDEPEMGGAGFERYFIQAQKYGATRQSALKHWATALSPESRAAWNAAPAWSGFDPPDPAARSLADMVIGHVDRHSPHVTDGARADALALAFVDVAERMFPGGLRGGGTTGVDFERDGVMVRVVAMEVPAPKEPLR